MNVLVIHGLHGNKRCTYEPYLEKEMIKRNIPIDFPDFPINENATYVSWKKTLDEYLKDNNILNKDTIIVSRCLGSRFILKYIAQKKIEIKGLISIASFIEDKVDIPEADRALKDFHVTNKEIQESIKLFNFRFAIYGDKDYMNDVSRLENFANIIKANKIFIRGMGHCGNSSGIKRFPQVVQIIDELIKLSK